ncbi:MAG: TrmH family RNA methyltransferase [Actinomycetota bacterium]
MTDDRPLGPTELKRLHRDWRRKGDVRLAMILDGVQNPYNLGSILRTAAAYRVETIWQVPPIVPVGHPKVAKTALGCERLVTTTEVATIDEALSAAAGAGFQTVAVELTGAARPLFTIDLARPTCLVVGHEERGVHRETLAAVDHVGFLPQLGKVGSLNVAQAATAAIWEVARQHWAGGLTD